MDARELILTELRDFCRYEPLRAELAGFTWDDNTFLRTAIIRIQHGDDSAWFDFVQRLADRPSLAGSVRFRLEDSGYLYYDFGNDDLLVGLFPPDITAMQPDDADALIARLSDAVVCSDIPDELPHRKHDARSDIMYIECKPGLTGPARIGRVTFSQTRKTIYYAGYKFQSLKGQGYKANFHNVETGMWYWISKCRMDGQDTLYPGIVKIDDDVRKEYWTTIRERPDMVDTTSFRSEGKYSKRRPQPEKPNHPASGAR